MNNTKIKAKTSRLTRLKKMILLLVLLILVMILYTLTGRLERNMTYIPFSRQRGVTYQSSYPIQLCEVQTPDGISLEAWHTQNESATATVLFCHGNGDNLGSLGGWIDYLLAFDVNVFAFDYRGYGSNEGKPGEEGLVIDGQAAFDALKKIDPKRPIIVMGHSLGGALAVQIAASRPAAGLIVLSSFDCKASMGRARMAGLPVEFLLREKWDSQSAIKKVECPILIAHGDKDWSIPYRLGKKLFDAAPEPKQFITIEGAGHNSVIEKGGRDFKSQLKQFIDEASNKDQTSNEMSH